jgi:16S rRNA (guanine527-N7)-methyltransferase
MDVPNPSGQPATLPTLLEVWQATLAWQPDANQQAQFQRLYELIVEGNRQFNLTRITEPQEFWEKHVWDSLLGILPVWQEEALHVIDIGTGAGFPGVPVAIAHPTWSVTLLDSTHKKMAFLDTVLEEMYLQNARTLTGRAETLGQDIAYRGQYDLVLIRAVAAVTVCLEYALPLLKLGGSAILYRGQWNQEEETTLTKAADQLGGAIATIDRFTTPLTQGIRHCVQVRKLEATPPEFPRAPGVPTQKPL